jgi:poly(A) polymerase
LPLPAYVREAIQVLGDAGHVAYVVGGSVRDFLLGRESKDHDIATSATPDELCELFPRAVTVGKAFGVIKVPVNIPEADAPVLMEIATFREDLEYVNHRHPKGVKFGGPEEDACRRDFTINALFYDPKTARLLDTVGGVQDLKAGVLRAIGDPSERFREDALRLLRAVRFAARLGFVIEPLTQAAIGARAKLITKVSAERVREELTLMWTSPRPSDALEMLARSGLLAHVLPDVDALRTQVPGPSGHTPWEKTLRVLATLAAQQPKRSPELSWAAVWLETAGRIEPPLGAEVARAAAMRLKMSSGEIERIGQILESQPKFRDVFKMREATLQRFVREPGFEEMLALHRADATVSDGNLASYEYCQGRWREAQATLDAASSSKLLDGKDLIQLGLQPGPEFSEILRVIEDLALEQRLRSKEEALEYVVRNFVR